MGNGNAAEYVKRVDEKIGRLPPLSWWEEHGYYPEEAEDALNAISDFLNCVGVKASRVYSSLHPCLPFIDIPKPAHLEYSYCLGMGFDEEMDYSDVDDHDKKEPELVFWIDDEKNPLYGDWDVWSASRWKEAFKRVLKIRV